VTREGEQEREPLNRENDPKLRHYFELTPEEQERAMARAQVNTPSDDPRTYRRWVWAGGALLVMAFLVIDISPLIATLFGWLGILSILMGGSLRKEWYARRGVHVKQW
jgi:hypothetical protein